MATTNKAKRAADAARKRAARAQRSNTRDGDDALAEHLQAYSYDLEAEERKAAEADSCMTREARHALKITNNIDRFCKAKRAYCKRNTIDFNEDALRLALATSELWTSWAANGGTIPKIFRRDRNLGYVAGNIFIGTAADAVAIGRAHVEQRREAREAGTYRRIDTTTKQRGPYGRR